MLLNMKHAIIGEEKIKDFILDEIIPLIKKTSDKTNKNANENAVVISLVGDLGAGKTTFTKYFAEILGVPKDQIISPTFIIQKRFELGELSKSFENGRDFKNLYHLDVYRTDSSKEISSLGWQELISNSKNIVLVEWADKIAEILPSDTIRLQFKFVDENTREIEILE
jgi:tRNA threonylcarbamoyladenosine biosynthesis protein TsaE